MEDHITLEQYNELIRKAAIADYLLGDIADRAERYSGYSTAEVIFLRDLLARDRIPQDAAE